MSVTHYYAELSPKVLAERLRAYPVAIAPWGALEWHGRHLPLGLDGLVAEGFSHRLAQATGAVLLPTTYLPITSLPHVHSISFSTELVAGTWAELFSGLHTVGFRLVCLVSGHYAQGHEIVLMETAQAAMHKSGLIVLAGTPLSLLEDPQLLDHAGLWETAQLQALHPELVHLDQIPAGALGPPDKSAVLGQDPRGASAEQGEKVLSSALDEWTAWIEKLLNTGDLTALQELYARRRAWYDEYVERYFQGSWEAAIEKWWRERTA